jgi:putative ABC transport system substrate-binding protein
VRRFQIAACVELRRDNFGLRIGLTSILFMALALTIAGAPLAVDAQEQAKVPRIGYLSPRSGPSHLDEAFRQGLRELGYVEGKNTVIDYRYAGWEWDRLSTLAADLVRRKVDILVATGGNATAHAAKSATSTIPIVFTAGDPVRGGLVASLARPGGNITGINVLTVELNVKRLQFLKEAVPEGIRIAVLVNPTSATSRQTLKDMEGAARSLGVGLLVQQVRDQKDLANAFVKMTRGRAEALAVMSDALFLAQREQIVALAAKSHLPAVYEFREFVDVGGLMSYGPNIAEMYRRLATYVDKILKGAKPGELPVEQPTKIQLVINLKTAKALGLTIPQSALLRADEVVQ